MRHGKLKNSRYQQNKFLKIDRQFVTALLRSIEEEMKQYSAEFLGTFWLVLGGCGSAVLAAAFPNVGIGLHGVRSRSV